MLNILIALISVGYIASKASKFSLPAPSIFASTENIALLICVFLLLPLNWLSEALKWKFLLGRIEKITLLLALKSVLAGLTFGLLTPARVGEIIGRPMFLAKKNFAKGTFAATAGSIAQFSVTLILGFLALAFYSIYFPKKVLISQSFSTTTISILALFLALCVILGYFNIQLIFKIVEKISFLKKIIKPAKVLADYTKKELSVVLSISFFRYLIFGTQFLLLLILLDVPLPLYFAVAGIALTYLVSTLIPVATFAEIGIRSSAAVFFLSGFSQSNEIAIAMATASVWLINVAIPALIGAFIWIFPKKNL